MKIRRLQLEHFRCFASAEFAPAPGFNLILGPNGSGKTSLLEALHLLGHGRSFRGRVRDGLVRQGQGALTLRVEWQDAEGIGHRAGLRHAGESWEARLDGEPIRQLGQLAASLAIISFGPGSHALVDGGSEARRRLLDWGLFHVEPGFMAAWRRYSRALKQRNALLRERASDADLAAFEMEMGASGERLSVLREAHAAALDEQLREWTRAMLPEAGDVGVQLQPGWRRREMALGDALLLARERDRALGHTTSGPHRADLRLQLAALPGRENLSRGQGKQLALALLLAQAGLLARISGSWPVLQLDDLGAELDRDHQRRALEALNGCGAQVIMTGVEPPLGLAGAAPPHIVFHVEHGVIRRAAEA